MGSVVFDRRGQDDKPGVNPRPIDGMRRFEGEDGRDTNRPDGRSYKYYSKAGRYLSSR
jgi:hypothetical protein